jgi:alcohol dehydrogenase class IV
MWFFNSPKIIFGEDALSWLGQFPGRKAYIVTDRNIEALGFVGLAKNLLASKGVEIQVFDDVEPDPCLQTVKRCAERMNQFSPDWVIGFGGGSSLDVAKAAWFLYERPDIELEAINPMEEFGLRAKARFLTISTTSGTGAEVSWGFALANPAEQCKVVRVSPELVPDIAIVDPKLVMGLSPQMTADTGMDVLTHAIEGYVNSFNNDFADGLCLKAIQLVFDYLPRAYKNGSDANAREHMHNAATIAGLGFSNTAIILGHALGHALSGIFHTIHGRTVGMFLPFTIEYIGRTAGERYTEIAYFLHLPSSSLQEGVSSLVKAVRNLQQELCQPTSIAQLGISEDAFKDALPHLVENVMGAPELVATPRIPYGEELERLLYYAYHGTPVDF